MKTQNTIQPQEIPIEQDITIDITESQLEIAYANQYDNNTSTVHCHIQNNGVNLDVSQYQVTLRVKKSNGKGYSATIGETGIEGCVTGNIVSFKIPKYITVSHGRQVCDLEFYAENNIKKYSCTFYIRVNKSALDEQEILDSDYYASVHDEYLKLEKDMNQKITEETDRAINAETKLTDDLDTEISRATERENEISDALTEEISRAATEESNIRNDLTDEISRAQQQEQALENSLNNEIQRAQSAEQTVQANAENYTDTKIADLINGAPSTLDTLGEIANAMAENQTVVEALDNAIGTKVDKIDGKGLSTEDYTTEEKNKLANLGANTITGVKGNAEDTYRQGDVNITPENIGALSVNGTTIHGAGTFTTVAPGFIQIENVNDGSITDIRDGSVRVESDENEEVNITGNKIEFSQGVVLDDSTVVGTLSATQYSGNAASATKATQDGNENVITDTYLTNTGDSKDNTITFTSNDDYWGTYAWTNVSTLTTGEKHSSILNKVSSMFKNIRFLYNMYNIMKDNIGDTNKIREIADGTVAGAIAGNEWKILTHSAITINSGTIGDGGDIHTIISNREEIKNAKEIYFPALTLKRSSGIYIVRNKTNGIYHNGSSNYTCGNGTYNLCYTVLVDFDAGSISLQVNNNTWGFNTIPLNLLANSIMYR